MRHHRGIPVSAAGADKSSRSRRRLLLSATVVMGLVIPTASAAVAAGTDSGRATTKREVFEQRKVSPPKGSGAVVRSQTAERLQLLAAQHEVRTLALVRNTSRGVGASPSVGARDQELAPDTTPTLTAPTDGATASGEVVLGASSTAPMVRFSIDGAALGAPIAVIGGAVSTQWLTWGLSNGPHTVGAVDCTNSDLCNTNAAEVSVNLANDAPVVTAPTAGQTLSGSATLTATAPGGAVAFVIDGVQRGLDNSTPYALTFSVSSLTDGIHSLLALGCSAAGVCDGPESAAVSFKTLSLHPRFTSISPTVFSANNDGRYDTTKATYYLPDTEAVRFQVRNSAGTVVRGPVNLGTKAKGTYSYVWNGLVNSGSRAPSGTYKLELVTSRTITGATLRGSAVASVRVDLAAPTMSTITGNGVNFYPYPDAYRDTFSPAFTLNEKSTATLTVKSSAGKVVRTLSASKPAGRTSITWNGRNNAGSLVAAGTYYWTYTAQDVAGNRRTTARYSVIVNSRRLITKTTTLVKNGSAFTGAGGSDYCAEADTSMSYFTHGVWLTNLCDYDYDGLQIAAAIYRFTLPPAVSYSSLRLDSYGYSLDTSTLGALFTRWGTADDFTATNQIYTPTAAAWRTIGSVSPAGLVNSSRVVESTVYLPNDTYLYTDYDVGQVRLVVTYKVLV